MVELLDILAKIHELKSQNLYVKHQLEINFYDFVMRELQNPYEILKYPAMLKLQLILLQYSKTNIFKSVKIAEIERQILTLIAMNSSERAKFITTIKMYNYQDAMRRMNLLMQIMTDIQKSQNEVTKQISRNLR